MLNRTLPSIPPPTKPLLLDIAPPRAQMARQGFFFEGENLPQSASFDPDFAGAASALLLIDACALGAVEPPLFARVIQNAAQCDPVRIFDFCNWINAAILVAQEGGAHPSDLRKSLLDAGIELLNRMSTALEANNKHDERDGPEPAWADGLEALNLCLFNLHASDQAQPAKILLDHFLISRAAATPSSNPRPPRL